MLFRGPSKAEVEKKKAENAYLYDKWMSLLGQLKEQDIIKINTISLLSVGTHVFDTMITKYMEKHRKYHNQSHIKLMLKLHNRLVSQKHVELDNRLAVEMAVFFHDVIYNTDHSYPRNVIESTYHCEAVLRSLKANPEFISAVKSLIRFTDYYRRTPIPAKYKKDAEYLHDLDFAYFGAAYDAFLTCTKKIKKEFDLLTRFKFARKRREFLLRMLSKPIFKTKVFRLEFESSARDNIKAYLGIL